MNYMKTCKLPLGTSRIKLLEPKSEFEINFRSHQPSFSVLLKVKGVIKVFFASQACRFAPRVMVMSCR